MSALDRRLLSPQRLRSAWISVVLFVVYACATTAPAPQPNQALHGMASWYGEEFAGRTTANGEIFDPLLLTAAHRTLPFGTVVDVKNPKTGQTVRVRINDRGPFVGNRVIDLSYAAAQQIGLIEPGVGDVDLTIVSLGRGDREPPVPVDVTIAEARPAMAPPVAGVPNVAFPLPNEKTPATTRTASTPDAAFSVGVTEERAGVVTRRQVAPDGRTIETVPVAGESGATADVPAAPGHSTAETADRPRTRTPVQVKAAPKFYVQVGAFAQEANAKALQDRLTRIGQQSSVTRADTLYRVRIGGFATREEAVSVRSALEASGLSAIVINE